MNNPGHVPLEYQDHLGSKLYRGVPNFEHATLCAAFSLDPASHWFDLPRSMVNAAEILSAVRSGAGRHRRIFGYVWRANRPKPVAILTVLPPDGDRPKERFTWDDKINDR